MKIGEESWRWVSLDSAGVPHGGRYGNVAWFQEEVKKIGLDLAWSRLYDAFFLFRRRSDGYCEPMMGCITWTTPVEPMPLNSEFLYKLRRDQHWFGFQTAALLQERQEQGARDCKWRMNKHRAELMTNAREDIMNEVQHKMGLRTRPLISIPSRQIVGMN